MIVPLTTATMGLLNPSGLENTVFGDVFAAGGSEVIPSYPDTLSLEVSYPQVASIEMTAGE